MSLDLAAAAALSNFAGCGAPIQLTQLARAGFSGCSVWKVAAGGEFFCLKCWPAENPPPLGLEWVHRLINGIRAKGLTFVPRFFATKNLQNIDVPSFATKIAETICRHEGCIWELMSWLPGDVDNSTQPSPARLRTALRALAAFHRATADWSEPGTDQPPSPRPALAIVERTWRLQQLIQGEIETIIAAYGEKRIPLLDDLAQQWISARRLPPLELLPRLMVGVTQFLPVQPVIRDIWREHVLFTGDEVTGFIDFGALRLDSFHVDLARLIGSLAGDDLEARTTAILAYNEVRPVSDSDIQLINLLDRSGTWIAGWNWLDWLYREKREFHSLVAVRERLAHLLSRQINW